MKWFPKGKATWPLEDMPARYFADNPSVPVIGAANEILASMVRAIDQLEARVESLEKQVHDLMQWP
jgi:hypothetical protein